MADALWQPDMIVGIDFGMTCTGVAWSMGPDWAPPRTVQHWPGKLGHEIRNKVDTAVAYDVKTGELAKWGFLCDPEDSRFEFNELFKLYLDTSYHDPTGSAPPSGEARTWFRDYLGCLRKCIVARFEDSIPRFATKRVEYVFSVPTTWKDPTMIADIEQLIRQAGYGQLNKERASVFLSEAEAAAVYTSKSRLEKDDVFLICDAGGGTTDVNVLKMESPNSSKMELNPLSWTEGRAAGSTLIDFRMHSLIVERLQSLPGLANEDLDSLAASMMEDKFLTFKCSFGSESMEVPKLRLPVPGVQPGLNVPTASVEDGQLVLTRDELRTVFDEQVMKMTDLIDEQLRKVQRTHPSEQISYLIMSGGLGTSPYVRKRMKEKYESGNAVTANARNMTLILADEPQLAVVHGLVMARMQASKGGPEIYSRRCCPVSYGIVCRQRYDPHVHQGEELVQDPYDKSQWAEGQITWVIRQGDTVQSDEGARQRYRMKLPRGGSKNMQTVKVVMSTMPRDMLPRSMKSQGAKNVCDVEFALEGGDMKLKNRHWYNLGEAYHQAEFDVRLLIGTGLKFEVWSGLGIRSKTHDEISVEWASSERVPNGPSAIYRA